MNRWRSGANPQAARARSTTLLLATTVVLVATSCETQADRVAVPIAGPPATSEEPDIESDFSISTDAPLDSASSTVPATTVAPSTTTTTAPTTTTIPVTTAPTTTTIPATVPATTAAPTASTIPLPAPPERAIANPFFGASNEAFDLLAATNAAASMTIVRGGEIVFSRGSGSLIDGTPATGDSPMVVASVSKLVIAVAIARLHEQGVIDIAAPMPWADIGIPHDAAWSDVTVRELLDHRSGLAKARFSWFTGEGTCRDYVPSLLTSPPRAHRGSWVYSNGNYCLLGLLVEQRTGLALDAALQQLVFDPVAADGVHLTLDGLRAGDVAHPDGVERLSRLGGAGTLIVSTDDTALALGRLTPADLAVLQPPGVFTDQYGWGHTGTVDGAKACIWVLDGGETVVSATIAGNSVSAGGGVCDIVVPAIGLDLGVDLGRPVRTP